MTRQYVIPDYDLIREAFREHTIWSVEDIRHHGNGQIRVTCEPARGFFINPARIETIREQCGAGAADICPVSDPEKPGLVFLVVILYYSE